MDDEVTAIVVRDRAQWGLTPFAQFLETLTLRSRRGVDAMGSLWMSDPIMHIVAMGLQLLIQNVLKKKEVTISRNTVAMYAPHVDRLVMIGLLRKYKTVDEAVSAFEQEVLSAIRAAATPVTTVPLMQIAQMPSGKFFAALYKEGREFCEGMLQMVRTSVAARHTLSKSNLLLLGGVDHKTDVDLLEKLLHDTGETYRGAATRYQGILGLMAREPWIRTFLVPLSTALAKLPFAWGVVREGLTVFSTVRDEVVNTQVVLALAEADPSVEIIAPAQFDAAYARVSSGRADDVEQISMEFLRRATTRGMKQLKDEEQRALMVCVRRAVISMREQLRRRNVADLAHLCIIDIHSFAQVQVVADSESADARISGYFRPEQLLHEHPEVAPITRSIKEMSVVAREEWMEVNLRPLLQFGDWSVDQLLRLLVGCKGNLYVGKVVKWMHEDIQDARLGELWAKGVKSGMRSGILRQMLANAEYPVTFAQAVELGDGVPVWIREGVVKQWFVESSEPEKGELLNLLVLLTGLPVSASSPFWTSVRYRKRFLTEVFEMFMRRDSLSAEEVRLLGELYTKMGSRVWLRMLYASGLRELEADFDTDLRTKEWDDIYDDYIAQLEEGCDLLASGSWRYQCAKEWVGQELARHLLTFRETLGHTEELVYNWMHEGDEGAPNWKEFRRRAIKVAEHLKSLRPHGEPKKKGAKRTS